MKKPLHHYPLAWIIAFLPVEIGLLFALFTETKPEQAFGLAILSYPLIAFVVSIFRSPLVFLLSLFFISKI